MSLQFEDEALLPLQALKLPRAEGDKDDEARSRGDESAASAPPHQ